MLDRSLSLFGTMLRIAFLAEFILSEVEGLEMTHRSVINRLEIVLTKMSLRTQ
jgi:hypothetical protein